MRNYSFAESVWGILIFVFLIALYFWYITIPLAIIVLIVERLWRYTNE